MHTHHVAYNLTGSRKWESYFTYCFEGKGLVKCNRATYSADWDLSKSILHLTRSFPRNALGKKESGYTTLGGGGGGVTDEEMAV